MPGLFIRLACWARAKALELVKRAVLAVLAAGPVPGHVAFVMDGNRRYARQHGLPALSGHSDGFVALERVRTYALAYMLNTEPRPA
jgi:ditrans,polycis-polyprenyl diphosphate synthase